MHNIDCLTGKPAVSLRTLGWGNEPRAEACIAAAKELYLLLRERVPSLVFTELRKMMNEEVK